MRGVIGQLIEADKSLKTPLPYLLLFMLLGCARVEAQEEEYPAPEIFRLTAQLDNPTDAQDPGPFLSILWYAPPRNVKSYGVEIYGAKGVPLQPDDTFNVLWLGGSTEDRIEKAGCIAHRTSLMLTSNCVDRYKGIPQLGGSFFAPFPSNFLRSGTRYEVRLVFLYAPDPTSTRRIWKYSPVYSAMMPTPALPTATPRPVATPWVMPTPVRLTPSPQGYDSEIDDLRRKIKRLEDINFRLEQRIEKMERYLIAHFNYQTW